MQAFQGPKTDQRRNPSYCRAAFNNLHIAIGGNAIPCCEFRGTFGNVKESSIEEIWRSDSLNELRVKMLRGERDKRCWKCWEAEDAGAVSLRDAYNSGGDAHAEPHDDAKILASDLPRALDLRLSNICNLSCRSCGPSYSTKWHADAKKAEWWKIHGRHALIESFDGVDNGLQSLASTLKEVERVHFAGGEPLLQEGHYAVLQHLIDLGRTDVAITYSSNLTELKLGKQEVIPLWSKFRNVSVAASIDGHKELGELVREGLSWDRFSNNLKIIDERCPHIILSFSITVSVLNIFTIQDLCEHLWAILPHRDTKIHFNVLQEPRRYSVQILPHDLKIVAKRRLEAFATRSLGWMGADIGERIQPMVNFMMFENRSGKIREFRERTLQLDKIRERNTATTIPELAPLLKETNFERMQRTVKQEFGTLVNKLR